jgi:hypothetical protein
MRAIRFAALAHIVGWVKRNEGTTYVGFAYLNAPQQFEIATKLANPTRSVADHRLNPTYDLTLWPVFTVSVSSSFPIQHSMLDVRCSMFIFFSVSLLQSPGEK